MLKFQEPIRKTAAQVEVEHPMDDGDRFKVDDVEFRVLHTPGHTAGSLSLWHEEEGVLIAGDALEYRRGRLALPSRLFTADMVQATASIRRLAALEVNILLLSHFPPVTEGASALLRTLAASFDTQ